MTTPDALLRTDVKEKRSEADRAVTTLLQKITARAMLTVVDVNEEWLDFILKCILMEEQWDLLMVWLWII